jgi:RNase H-fold protein (predicted Holliday junction resolvase)
MTPSDRSTTLDVRVVAIDPGGQRFGFAALEGQDRLIGWGLRKFPGDRTPHGIRRVLEVVEFYKPDAIVTEDVSSKHAGRSQRTRRLVKPCNSCAKRCCCRMFCSGSLGGRSHVELNSHWIVGTP